MELFLNVLLNLIIAAVVIWVVVSIVEEIKESKAEKEKRKKERLARELRLKKREKGRQAYYNNLPIIYDGLSTQTLIEAYHLLVDLNQWKESLRDYEHNRTVIPGEKVRLEGKWFEARQKFTDFINPNDKYLWKTDTENMKAPLWIDLDIKYVYQLLNKRK